MKIDSKVVEHLFSEAFGHPLRDGGLDRQRIMQFAEAIEKEALQLQSDEQQDFGTGPAILGKGSSTSVTAPNEIPWQIQVRLRCAEAVAFRTHPGIPTTVAQKIEYGASQLCQWVMNGDQAETGIPGTEGQSVEGLMSGVSIHDTVVARSEP